MSEVIQETKLNEIEKDKIEEKEIENEEEDDEEDDEDEDEEEEESSEEDEVKSSENKNGQKKKEIPIKKEEIPDSWEAHVEEKPKVEVQPAAPVKKMLKKLNPNAGSFNPGEKKPDPVASVPQDNMFMYQQNMGMGGYNQYGQAMPGMNPMPMGGMGGGYPPFNQGMNPYGFGNPPPYGFGSMEEYMYGGFKPSYNEGIGMSFTRPEYSDDKPEKKVQEPKEKKIPKRILKEMEKAKEGTNPEGNAAVVPKKKKPKKLEDIDNMEVDVTKFTEVDETRVPINIVFIGHVDAGKSTICGNILVISGKVDKNEIRKYELEAKEKKRESWYLAYVMDINEEERSKGKTVEVGKAHFTTNSKRYTILDAPGHKNYVPNMIAGAAQADIAALVISAKTGEFESGFEKAGQTQEHAMLAKCLGVKKMIVLVNKMDEEKWSEKRYQQIQESVTPFLQNNCGFNAKDVKWIPISGLFGDNLNKLVDKTKCPWYTGPTFFEILDNVDPPERDPTGPIRIPVLDKFRDQGLNLYGKIESGTIQNGKNY